MYIYNYIYIQLYVYIYMYRQATHPDSSMWCPTRRSPQVLSTMCDVGLNVILTYVNRDLMGFHRDFTGIS